MTIAVLAALGAAALFAVSSAMQHRSASDVPSIDAWRGRDVGRFAANTLRHRWWLIGTAADALGLGLHALALDQGALTVVQPLLVSGLVFALPLRQWIDRSRPARGELAWAVVLVAGLAAFLAAAAPTSDSLSGIDHGPAVITAAILACAVAGLAWSGLRAEGATAARNLALATGVTFAGSAALIKAVTTIAVHHPGHLLTTWPVYALVAVGAAGLFLNQLAFQAGPLSTSLPAITASDPVVSLIVGVVVYDERLRTSAWALCLETAGLAVIVLAAITLGRAAGRRQGPSGNEVIPSAPCSAKAVSSVSSPSGT